jgi:ankyrin repeat protein
LAAGGLKRICKTLFDLASNETTALAERFSLLVERAKAMAEYCKSNIDKSCITNGAALHLAAREREDSVLSLLIQWGASVEMEEGTWGLKAVHFAASHEADWNLSVLAAGGADITSIARYGNTPLVLATTWGSHKCIRLLLDKGAKASDRDTSNNTVLHHARNPCALKTVRLITGAYPDAVNVQNSFAQTPLHYFAAADTEILNYIMSVPNIQLSLQDDEGNTALHGAASGGSVENVVLLLNPGADVSVHNASSCTPLDSALIIDIAKVLVSRTSITTPGTDSENR